MAEVAAAGVGDLALEAAEDLLGADSVVDSGDNGLFSSPVGVSSSLICKNLIEHFLRHNG